MRPHIERYIGFPCVRLCAIICRGGGDREKGGGGGGFQLFYCGGVHGSACDFYRAFPKVSMCLCDCEELVGGARTGERGWSGVGFSTIFLRRDPSGTSEKQGCISIWHVLTVDPQPLRDF